MKISDRLLEKLAEMVVGDEAHFPYRSSSYITLFFERCGLPFVHDGTTRPFWAKQRLMELNLGPCPAPDLPSKGLCQVITELFDPYDFERFNEKLARQGVNDPAQYADIDKAIERLNTYLKRDGLEIYKAENDRCYLKSKGTGTSTAGLAQPDRPLSKEEIEQRVRIAAFLDEASEDEFTETVLMPLFKRLGFHQVNQVSGVN